MIELFSLDQQAKNMIWYFLIQRDNG